MQAGCDGLHVVLPVEIGSSERGASPRLEHRRLEEDGVADLGRVQVPKSQQLVLVHKLAWYR